MCVTNLDSRANVSFLNIVHIVVNRHCMLSRVSSALWTMCTLCACL